MAPTVTAIELSAKDIDDLPDGVSLKTVGKAKLVLYKEDGQLKKACNNKCVHMGGVFAVDVEDTAKQYVKCTMHGWMMDASTMTYPDQLKSITTCCVKGTAETKQPQLEIKALEGGGVEFFPK
ncbi:unnamed protein product [Polarella glacialis]|nr:unnamed protein product [Polarella glacialis]